MTRKARRVDSKGRSIGNDSHARIYPWEYKSAAFQSLSNNAVRLLLELKMLHNGRNNGSLFLSVREAARRIHVGKNQAAQAFDDLQERGFIRPNVIGAFSLKSGARHGMATSWVLTEFPIGEEKGAGSRDFMRWTPQLCPQRAHPKTFDGARSGHTVKLPGGSEKAAERSSKSAAVLGSKPPAGRR